jgi:hypothetical protein
MGVVLAAAALLFDIGNLTVRRHFTVATRDASATKGGESEETN